MKIYKNVYVDNSENMSYSDLMDAVKIELAKDGIQGETATIIADLMVRFDEDVTEENGQFYTY